MSSSPAELIQFRHLGFEHFDLIVLAVILGRMALAGLFAGMVAYRPWRYFMPWHFERTESGAQVLIAVAGALMTGVIGNNVALAFGLVGLGGFIRFRSGIKDPREAGVMFLMIGIGMACGTGQMPVAIVAVICGLVLLPTLDIVDHNRAGVVKRRLRFAGIKDPRTFEPEARSVIGRYATVRGSKISIKREEISVDVYGDRFSSAGEVLQVLAKHGLDVHGDVSCEEI